MIAQKSTARNFSVLVLAFVKILERERIPGNIINDMSFPDINCMSYFKVNAKSIALEKTIHLHFRKDLETSLDLKKVKSTGWQ